jgi:hypothetical protein
MKGPAVAYPWHAAAMQVNNGSVGTLAMRSFNHSGIEGKNVLKGQTVSELDSDWPVPARDNAAAEVPVRPCVFLPISIEPRPIRQAGVEDVSIHA